MTQLEINTDRLQLREVRQTDFDAIHAYCSDRETTRFLGWGPNDAQTTQSFMDAWFNSYRQVPRKDYDLAVCHVGGSYLGTVWVNVDDSLRQGAIGWIIDRRYQRRGYAAEAAAALLGFCFETLGLHRVYAKCDTENIASYRLMEKLGMRREARFRQSTLLQGNAGCWRDEYLYALLSCQWAAV